MLAYKAKPAWSIYRRRMLWYLALVLLVVGGPEALVRPLRLYLCLSAGAVVMAFIGLNPTWFWQFSRRDPVSRRVFWFDFGLCALGEATAMLGLLLAREWLMHIGVLMALAGADCALLAHESNGRFLLARRSATQP
ncbi:hypothetical protein GALL_380420 [mine drainage metagenome]|jgi:hypothetical protein|uniref:Uncharacterized protein n=1 Tax=mine drainage metagenome TaxID=410659 RepID=A0A1J5QJU1_9ZZZZ